MAFRIISAETGQGHIDFMASQHQSISDENYFTILIGRNGTGKSSLLSRICKEYLYIERQQQNETRYYGLSKSPPKDGFRLNAVREFPEQVDLSLAGWPPSPRRLIVTTITPFDKFPIPYKWPWHRGQPDEGLPNSIYRYLGARMRMGFSSGASQTSRIVESLIFASEKRGKEAHQLLSVFELLNLEPRLKADYRIRGGSTALKHLTNASNLNSSLQALEYIYRNVVGNGRIEFYRHRFCEEFANDVKFHLSKVIRLNHRQRVEIDLDFRHGSFLKGSLDIFDSVLFLKSAGLINYDNLSLFKEGADPDGFSLREASSGEQSVILTFLGIGSEIADDSLILIDEPEISLHPDWQEKLLPMMNSVFGHYKGCHFVVATHSPLLLSNGSKIKGSIVQMEDGTTEDISEYSSRSADYQLATAFDSPGFRNEYLARIALSIIVSLGKSGKISSELNEHLIILRRIRPSLSSQDPVANMIDAIQIYYTSSEL